MDRAKYENIILELVNEGMAMEAIRDLSIFQLGNIAEQKEKLGSYKATMRIISNLCDSDTSYKNRIEVIKGVLEDNDV